MTNYTVDLQTARNAASQLQALQFAASQLPALENEQVKSESLARLEFLRIKTRQDIASLYTQFEQSVTAYKQSFDGLLTALQETAKLLKRVLDLQSAIREKVNQYSSAKVRHSLQFENSNSQKDYLYNVAPMVESQAVNEVMDHAVDFKLFPENNFFAQSIFNLLTEFIYRQSRK